MRVAAQMSRDSVSLANSPFRRPGHQNRNLSLHEAPIWSRDMALQNLLDALQ
jgi:hypothetical protein